MAEVSILEAGKWGRRHDDKELSEDSLERPGFAEVRVRAGERSGMGEQKSLGGV